MCNMRILGVDPGVSPALAFLSRSSTGNRVLRVPRKGHGPDESFLRAVVAEEKPDRAVVELVGAMAGQGLASTAHLMASWGLIRGILCGLGIPYILVTPQTWKKAMLTDEERGAGIDDRTARKEHQKRSAVAWGQRHYPRLNLIAAGKKVASHDLAESVLLAAYGIHHAQK